MKILATLVISISLLFAAESVTLASDHGRSGGGGSGRSFGESRGGFGGGGRQSFAYGGSRSGGGRYYGGRGYYGGGRGYGRGYGGYGGYYYGGYPIYLGSPYYGDYPTYSGGGYYSDDANGTSSAANDNDSIDSEVQQDLAQAGYYHGPIDGVVGPMTRSAISAYQRDNGLHVTGTITHGLLDSLNGD